MCSNRYIQMYLSRARENIPCNWIAIGAFFVIFTLLDHIRGLGTLIGLLVLLPLHCNKRASDDTYRQGHSNTQNLLVLCTEQSGVHRSCTALYFWCAANGITESLALTLHGPVEKVYFVWLHVVLVFCLWGITLLITALLIDSLSVVVPGPPREDIEAPPPVTRVKYSSITAAPQ